MISEARSYTVIKRSDTHWLPKGLVAIFASIAGIGASACFIFAVSQDLDPQLPANARTNFWTPAKQRCLEASVVLFSVAAFAGRVQYRVLGDRRSEAIVVREVFAYRRFLELFAGLFFSVTILLKAACGQRLLLGDFLGLGLGMLCGAVSIAMSANEGDQVQASN